MANPEEEIATYLLTRQAELASLVQQLRTHIKQTTKPAIEIVFDSFKSINIGYGFTPKAWDCYCAIIVYRNHINLSFPSGASLNDRAGILVGSGSRVRHVRINNLDDIKEQVVIKVLAEARALAFSTTGDQQKIDGLVQTIIKYGSGGR